MIESKADLKEYIKLDMDFYHNYSLRDKFFLCVLKDPAYYIVKYLKYLRYEEYYSNVRKDLLGHFFYLYYLRKKNNLGNKLGFKIPRNCFGKGLTIYHHGNIIVNEDARIGLNCKLHGNNCIGNNGITNSIPIIGNNLDLGFGANIIGGVKLGNGITVGANAVVVNHFEDNNQILVGVPAKQIKR